MKSKVLSLNAKLTFLNNDGPQLLYLLFAVVLGCWARRAASIHVWPGTHTMFECMTGDVSCLSHPANDIPGIILIYYRFRLDVDRFFFLVIRRCQGYPDSLMGWYHTFFLFWLLIYQWQKRVFLPWDADLHMHNIFFSHILGGVVKLAITQAERPIFMHFVTLGYPDSLLGSYHTI